MAARRASFSLTRLGDVGSLEEFIRRLFALRAADPGMQLVYRGQGDGRDALLPTIGRPHAYGGREKTFSAGDEVDLLHRFRRRAYPQLGRALAAGEALFVARHYGLPTRLLDWTANALYALYFACVEEPHCDGGVWAMRQRDSRRSYVDPFRLASLEGEAALFGARSRLAWPGKRPGEWIKIVYPLFNPPRVKARIVRELSGLGITHRVVFPDLDGIARSVWETDVLWNSG
ncbi:MAG TPA: FRG domain-containing protein [Burkholderiales bacterium]